MDIEELIDLVRQHGKAIYSFCYRLTGNKADSEDLYQETFLKAIEMIHKMDVNRNPRAFLVSIAVRLHKNHRRKWAWRQRIAPTVNFDGVAETSSLPSTASEPEDIVLSEELRGAVLSAANQLNEKLKIPLFMFYTAELSVEEIAAALRIPAGTVKSRLHQARKTMKTILEVESREGI